MICAVCKRELAKWELPQKFVTSVPEYKMVKGERVKTNKPLELPIVALCDSCARENITR